MRWVLVVLTALALGAAVSASAKPKKPPASKPAPPKAEQAPYCLGTYADDLNLMSLQSRRLEQGTRYTYCVRSTAVYQCLSYDREGNVRKRKETVLAHGTAFAFRRVPGYTYLLTNEHVSEWPLVSETEIDESVPPGCKRISQTISIVDDEKDEYDADDIALTRVVVDPEIDATILRAPARLPVMPFRLGQSSALRAGNAVQARGFPLGAFFAVNVGKVVTPHDHDTEKKWDHDDFVIDALLSVGNSGSPVMAVNCATKELELVGIYHAGYKQGNALNVVVGIDDLRDAMTTLKPRKKRPDMRQEISVQDRARLVAAIKSPETLPVVPFGPHFLGIRAGHGGALLYDFFGREYPLSDRRLLVVEDLPTEGDGRIGRLWFGNERGLLEYSFGELERVDQVLVERAVATIRIHVLRVLQYRGQQPVAARSRAGYDKLRAIERQLKNSEPTRRDLGRGLVEAASRYSADATDDVVTIAATLGAPSPPPHAPSPAPVAGKDKPPARREAEE